jgi:hypothetical protein
MVTHDNPARFKIAHEPTPTRRGKEAADCAEGPQSGLMAQGAASPSPFSWNIKILYFAAPHGMA